MPDQDPAQRITSYILCTSPRSGSTLLCHLLRTSGVAGRPGSLFHEPSLTAWCAVYGLEPGDFPNEPSLLQAILARAIAKGEAGTGVFGLRLQRGSFGFFMAQLTRLYPGLATDRQRIEAAFGPVLFIHLSRADKLAQAVSRVIAEQTGLWHRHADGRELERLAPPQAPVYDPKPIARHMQDLTNLEAEWQAWFAREEITPLRLSYEALSENPQACLGHVLGALGQDPASAATIPTPTAKLADQISADWIARFRADHPRA